MNTEDFVTYEQAVKLKECGFDWDCQTYYTNDYMNDDPEDLSREVKFNYGFSYNQNIIAGCFSAPTMAQAAKWLRDKYNLHVQIESVIGKRWTYTLVDTAPQSDIGGEYYDRIPDRDGYQVFDTYESALSAGIDAALNIISNN